MAKKINHAVGEMTGYDIVEHYLNVLAAFEWGYELDRSDTVSVGEIQTKPHLKQLFPPPGPIGEVVVDQVSPYFSKDSQYQEHIRDKIVEFPSAKARHLENALQRLYWGNLVNEVIGQATKRPLVDDVVDIFKDHGIDLRPFMLPMSEQKELRLLDEFFRVIGEALIEVAKKPHDVRTKKSQEGLILMAYTNLFIERLDRDKKRFVAGNRGTELIGNSSADAVS